MSNGVREGSVRSLSLRPDLAEVTRARRFLAELCAEAGFSEERIFDISVACSEAIANAIEHAPVKGRVGVTAVLHTDRLEVQVEGPGEFQAPDRTKERGNRGLGLPLMAKLCDHLALFSGPSGGTLVALTFYRPGALTEKDAQSSLPPSITELIRENEFAAQLLGGMTDGLVMLDKDWRCSYVSDRAAEILGVAPDSLVGRNARDFIPQSVRARFEEMYRRSVDTGQTVHFEEYYPEPVDRWFEVHCYPTSGGLLIYFHDVTERKVAEERLRLSKEELQVFFDRPGVMRGIVEVVDDQTVLRVKDNQETARFMGSTVEALKDKLSSDLGEPAETVREWVSHYRESERTGRPVTFEYPDPRADSEGWLSASVSYLRAGPSGRSQFAYILRNVTEEKRAEETARESELKYQRLHESMRDAFAIVDMQGRVQEANAAFREMLGYTDEELHQLTYKELTPEKWHAMEARIVAEQIIPLGTSGVYEKEYRRKDGTVLPVELRTQLIRDAAGSPQQMWAIVRDVSARRSTEDALRESEERYRALAEVNARLYRRQLQVAEDLQSVLVHIPSEIGRVRLGHLYRSATEAARVGGDFYDVFEVKEGKVGVLIGDVAGHGIQAARTATLVKDVVHAFAHRTFVPKEVLRSTNQLLTEKGFSGFVTLFFGVLDPDAGTLRYSSAGHPEVLVRRRTGQMERLTSGTLPLGVFADASWTTQEAKVDPGDLLFLYTDGIIEARRGAEFFGETRLEALVARPGDAVEDLPASILQEVLDFSGGSLRDDVAMLALRFDDDGGCGARRHSR